MEKKSDKNVAAQLQAKQKVVSEADKIWEDIKDIKLEMFALPNQYVNMFCKKVNIEPTKCYMVASASATLPALEVALKDKYNVEQMDKYIVISKIEKKL